MATAFIPAKGKSTRIPHKNMTVLGDAPLLQWTLNACKQWSRLSKVVVATDDSAIAELSEKWGAEVYELGSDDSADLRTVSQLWKHFCSTRSGTQVLFHPTNPFRCLAELENAWEKFASGNFDVIISVREERNLILDSHGKPYESGHERMTRLTQHVKPNYILDGSFYIANAEYVNNCKYFEEGRALMFPVSLISGLEIDTPEDLELSQIVASSLPKRYVSPT